MNSFLDKLVDRHDEYLQMSKQGLISISKEHVHLEREKFLDLFGRVKVEYEAFDEYCLSAKHYDVKFICLIPCHMLDAIKEVKEVIE